MIKVLSVFGTRAEATKMVPLVLEMRDNPQIDSKICVTAQHRELLDQVLTPFNIVPDYDLDIMTAGQTITDVVTRVLQGLAPILAEVCPNIVLVHGDTATSFAAALAAFYARVPVGHVEAGLRTYDKYRPYPEEINRKLNTGLADLHFAPTRQAEENLLKENVPANSIYVTGNTAIDFIKYTISANYRFNREALNNLDFSKRIILMTAHRGENRGQAMEEICRAVSRLVKDFPDTFFVWPMHPNNAAAAPAKAILGGQERVLLTEAIDVFDMHNLMTRTHLLLTDSGGLQEEAPSFDLPTVVLREVTERPEGLVAGTLVVAGVDEDTIYNEAARLLTNSAAYAKMAAVSNPFGDGKASERIIKAILENMQC